MSSMDTLLRVRSQHRRHTRRTAESALANRAEPVIHVSAASKIGLPNFGHATTATIATIAIPDDPLDPNNPFGHATTVPPTFTLSLVKQTITTTVQPSSTTSQATPTPSATSNTSSSSPSTSPSSTPRPTSSLPTPATSQPNNPPASTNRSLTGTTSTATTHAAASPVMASSSPSSGAIAAASGSISTAGIVGISAAGIVGAAIVAGLVTFFLRRARNRRDNFDSTAFRRQSLALNDDVPSPIYSARAHPPSMIEKRLAAQAAVGQVPSPMQMQGPSYGPPVPHNNYAVQGAPIVPATPSFSPGQYVPQTPLPYTSPQYNPMSQSPLTSPTSTVPQSPYDDRGQLIRQPSSSSYDGLSRSNSAVAGRGLDAPAAEYADLMRTSVTPFQAAQYAAISRQLNIPNPSPNPRLVPVNESEDVDPEFNPSRRSSNLPPPPVPEKDGPITPQMVKTPKTAQTTETTPSVYDDTIDDARSTISRSARSPFADPSQEITRDSVVSEGYDELEPPSPFTPGSAHSRIPSTPPILPEIHLQQRAFSPVEFPVSVHGTPTPSPMVMSFTDSMIRSPMPVILPGPSSDIDELPPPPRGRFDSDAPKFDGPETPVTLGFGTPRQSYSAPSPRVAPSDPPRRVPSMAPSRSSRVSRADTIYDDEDAYGA